MNLYAATARPTAAIASTPPQTARRRRSLRLIGLLALLLAGCAWRESRITLPPTLILISIDGFHPAYLALPEAVSLRQLAADGALAAALRPAFPSQTFPNHYTLVTGLHPDRHGIVHNRMRDAQLGDFAKSGAPVRDPRWWGGEPVWATAQEQGLRAATLFWPGSEAPVRGRLPHTWLPYDGALPASARVQRALDWLARPVSQRPHFVTLYFESVDLAGHRFGPRSAEVRAAIAEVDAALSELLAGLGRLQRLGEVNLVVVSDHGMAELEGGEIVLLDELLDVQAIEPPVPGEVVGLTPLPGREAEVAAALLRPHARMSCHRREALPARWQHGRHPRVAPILCVAAPPHLIGLREHLQAAEAQTRNRGGHGYDPGLSEMAALFIGHGPGFRSGARLPQVDAVDVYALLCRLLGIVPAPHQGDPHAFDAALQPRRLEQG
jgi:predicted AlkP superfamily pyrophosphatase or phosphodiesterase